LHLLNKYIHNPVLIVSATMAEVEPLFKLASNWDEIDPYVFRIEIGNNFLHLLITGVGVPSTVFHVSSLLSIAKFSMLINIGIAGSYSSDIENGNVVLISEDCYGDLGIERKSGFISLFEAGLTNPNHSPFIEGKLIHKVNVNVNFPNNIRKVKGLTVNVVTSNNAINEFRKKKFNAEVETMESAAVFYCCLEKGTPFLSLRGISNKVGEEDKSKWLITEAIQNSCNALIEILDKNNFFINEA